MLVFTASMRNHLTWDSNSGTNSELNVHMQLNVALEVASVIFLSLCLNTLFLEIYHCNGNYKVTFFNCLVLCLYRCIRFHSQSCHFQLWNYQEMCMFLNFIYVNRQVNFLTIFVCHAEYCKQWWTAWYQYSLSICLMITTNGHNWMM